MTTNNEIIDNRLRPGAQLTTGMKHTVKRAPPSLLFQRHFDRFSRFCTADYGCIRNELHSDTDTHRPRYVQHLWQWAASMHVVQAVRSSNNGKFTCDVFD